MGYLKECDRLVRSPVCGFVVTEIVKHSIYALTSMSLSDLPLFHNNKDVSGKEKPFLFPFFLIPYPSERAESQVINNYDTKSSAHFRPHTCRTNIKQFTKLFRGPKIWNALPLSVTSSPSLSTFKRKLFYFLS